MMRFTSLDSLRGIAALTVVLHHIFLTFPQAIVPVDLSSLSVWLDPVTYLRYSPLRTIVGGRPAVILFFALSGFVLALPFAVGRSTPYPSYLVKRFCRIYIPFAASIAFAAMLASLSPAGPIQGLSDWFNMKSWTEPVSIKLILSHLLMLGTPSSMDLNNVMWSLVHEMRISLFFPLIALFLLRARRIALPVFFMIWLLASAIVMLFRPDPLTRSLLDTAIYTLFFALGAQMAIDRTRITDIVSSLSRPALWSGLALAFTLFAVPPGLPGAELLYGLASIMVIAAALGNNGFRTALEHDGCQWLGRISYSLYLFHLPVLLFLFRWFYGEIHPALIIAASLAIIVPVAALAYKSVEVPSMALGRRLGAALAPETGKVRQSSGVS
ncbi:acyltransferase [Rhizobium sp. S95]|uniref:Acyltransferase n=1 Tax=Ciceribacter sichuanensis TaxID=2949647 RepID=A0AAJ1FIA8_9HYPH|nr:MULTISPECIES: acyltransferase [unclassified Ciceribacter]MCM2399013.1 acyltransferase [Ciceribacter sp. S95]MCO5956781.1 acyltransferase [Ciceribacter sp. S101]